MISGNIETVPSEPSAAKGKAAAVSSCHRSIAQKDGLLASKPDGGPSISRMKNFSWIAQEFLCKIRSLVNLSLEQLFDKDCMVMRFRQGGRRMSPSPDSRCA